MSDQQPSPELAGDPVHESPVHESPGTTDGDQDAEPPTPTGAEPDVDDSGVEHPDPEPGSQG
jgi:hypothetical protein